MARLNTCGWESGSVNELYSGLTATVTGDNMGVATSPVRSGTYSLKIDYSTTASTGGRVTQINLGAGPSNTLFSRFYLYLTAIPTERSALFRWNSSTAGVGTRGSVSINTNGSLQIYNGATSVGSASSALSLNTWYCVQTSSISDGANQTVTLVLDGVTVASGVSFVNTNADSSVVQLGWSATGGAGSTKAGTYYVDDFAVNYEGGGGSQTSFPGDGKLLLLLPVADSAVGTGWTLGTGTATGGNAFNALNNVPPVGVADLAAGSDGKQVRNAASAANSNLDVQVTDYATAGIASIDTINLVAPVVILGAPSATNSKTGTMTVVSNPAGSAAALGNFYQGFVPGTYPAGWTGLGQSTAGTTEGDIATGNRSTKPVVRLTQVTSSTRVAMACFLGLYVDYTPPFLVTLTGSTTSSASVAATVVNPGAVTHATTSVASVVGVRIQTGDVTATATTSAASVVGVRIQTGVVTATTTAAASVSATAVGPGLVTAPITDTATIAGARTDVAELTAIITNADTTIGVRTQTGDVITSTVGDVSVDGIRTQLGDIASASASASVLGSTVVGPGETTAAVTSADLTTAIRVQFGDIDSSITSAGSATAERLQFGDVDDPIGVDTDVVANVVGPGEVTQTVHGDSTVDGIRTQYGDVNTSTVSVDDTEAIAVGPGQITSTTSTDVGLVGVRTQLGDLDTTTTSVALLVGQVVGPGSVDPETASDALVVGAAAFAGDIDTAITATALVLPYQYDTAKVGAEASVNAQLSAQRIQTGILTPIVTASVVPWAIRADTAGLTSSITAEPVVVGQNVGDGGPADLDIAIESVSSVDAVRVDVAELIPAVARSATVSGVRRDTSAIAGVTESVPEIEAYLTGGGVIDGVSELTDEITAYLTEAGRVGSETTCMALVSS
jgi:hypothetical protein